MILYMQSKSLEAPSKKGKLMSEKRTALLVSASIVVIAVLCIFRGTVLSFFDARWQNAIEWHVNPFIFVGLLFATLYHYYKSWWQIGKGVVTKDKQAIYKGIALNRFVWAIPYLYVLIFGRGYPWWVPVLIIAWMIFGALSFAHNYRKTEYIDKITNSHLGRFIFRGEKVLPESLEKEKQ